LSVAEGVIRVNSYPRFVFIRGSGLGTRKTMIHE
jgi:hypothetical protein